VSTDDYSGNLLTVQMDADFPVPQIHLPTTPNMLPHTIAFRGYFNSAIGKNAGIDNVADTRAVVQTFDERQSASEKLVHLIDPLIGGYGGSGLIAFQGASG
jgi:hypothetical protein